MSAPNTTELQRPSRTARTAVMGVSLALAVLTCACGAAPVDARKPAQESISILQWGHPWSILNFLGFAVTTYVAWELSYYFVFRKRIETTRPSAPWPRDAFAHVDGGVLFADRHGVPLLVRRRLQSPAQPHIPDHPPQGRIPRVFEHALDLDHAAAAERADLLVEPGPVAPPAVPTCASTRLPVHVV